jgi:phospholipid/cholesterol/gamma-HCH transport system substrate-binding protein
VPISRGTIGAARVLTVAAIALAVLAAATLLFSSGGGYEVKFKILNASQLVRGNQVKVGGIPVGSLEDISLAPDGEAEMKVSIDDGSLTPLHQGSRIEVRSSSLSGIANRYLALTPGPNNLPKIPNGGEIPASDATPEVDLDEVLNALDPQVQADLRTATRDAGSAFSGPAGKQLNAAIQALNPALSQTDATEREILRDQPAFERFILESADVVGAVASRPADLTQLVGNARGTLDALASRNSQLDSVLQKLPPTLRSANTTLVNLRGAISDIRPTVRAAKPAAPLLAEFLTRLRPVTREGRPTVGQLRAAIDRPGSGDLLGVLSKVPSLEAKAVPSLQSALKTVNDALPIVREARPYTPDLIGGLFNGFGGTTSSYYDANGRYTRISFQGSIATTPNLLSLVLQPPSQQGLAGFREGVTKRCPGAATQSAPDNSNPFVPASGFPCSTGDSPR